MFVSLYIIYRGRLRCDPNSVKKSTAQFCQFHASLRQCNIALTHFQYKCIPHEGFSLFNINSTYSKTSIIMKLFTVSM